MKDIVFNYTGHRELWDEIIRLLKEKNTNITSAANAKHFAAKNLNISDHDIPNGYCYACEYDEKINMYKGFVDNDCKNCPLIWPQNSECTLESDMGVYDLFRNAIEAKNIAQAIEYAIIIRDCKVKDNIKYK